MHRTVGTMLVLTTFLFSACALSHLAHGRRTDFRFKELANSLKPGMTNKQAEVIIAKHNEHYSWHWSGLVGQPAFSRYQLDPNSYLILKYTTTKDGYGNISNDDTITSFEIVSFSDLKDQLTKSTFKSICLIHQSPSPEPGGFDPVNLMRAVNHLQKLGVKQSLRLLRTYHDLATGEDSYRKWCYDLDEQRIFLIVRLLFVRKDGIPEMPAMRIGATAPQIPRENKEWPLFPLALDGDIPFFMASGYWLTGVPESPLRHIEYCEKNCYLRKAPMTASKSPIEAIEDITGSNEWKALFLAQETHSPNDLADCLHKYHLRCQALRCFPSSLSLPTQLGRKFHPYCSGSDNAEKAWQEYLKELKRIKLEWSEEKNRFSLSK